MDKTVQSWPYWDLLNERFRVEVYTPYLYCTRVSLYLALITASPVKPKSINTFELCSIDKSSNQQSGQGTAPL